MAKLIIESGEDVGSVYELTGSTTIGRSTQNPIYINDTRASRENSRITKESDGFYVTDLDSQNGTLVNEEKIKIRKLNYEDLITIGRTTFRFVLDESRAVKVSSHMIKETEDMVSAKQSTSKTDKMDYQPSIVQRIFTLLILLIFFAGIVYISKLAGETIFDNIVKAQRKAASADKSLK